MKIGMKGALVCVGASVSIAAGAQAIDESMKPQPGKYNSDLTLIDADHQLLPDNITLPLMWLGLLVNTVDLGMGVSVNDALIGAMAGYLSLWSVYWLFKLATGKEGMGFGDFKLLAALGAWLGGQSLLPIVILSSLVGAVYGIVSILAQGRDKSRPMPFGPYLAGAGFLMLIWGAEINTFYSQTFLA